jgi:transcription initiation factor IIE alpha subunit
MKCPKCNHTFTDPEVEKDINRIIEKINKRIQELEELKMEKMKFLDY